jgi:dTMP kinase
VCFEGLDGSGKSTQARLLQEALGAPALSLREPSKGPFGTAIRATARTGRLSPLREHGLFLKDREWDCHHNILPALKAGITVVMDRYIISNIAYQGALGVPLHSILEDNLDFPWPDLTILLELDVPKALARIRDSRGECGLFEREGFLRKVSAILNILELPNVVRLDASLGEKTILKKVLKIVKDLTDANGILAEHRPRMRQG